MILAQILGNPPSPGGGSNFRRQVLEILAAFPRICLRPAKILDNLNAAGLRPAKILDNLNDAGLRPEILAILGFRRKLDRPPGG